MQADSCMLVKLKIEFSKTCIASHRIYVEHDTDKYTDIWVLHSVLIDVFSLDNALAIF